MAAPTHVQLSQHKFLMAGGMFELPLQMLREKGILASDYEHQEYPKWLGLEPPVLVHSADEEDRVLAGGRTSDEMEEERLDLIQRCRNLHITVDPSWTVVRLRRELGDKMDEPVASPEAKMAALEKELEALRKMEAMEREIADLRARLARREEPDEADALRGQLQSLGIAPDGRWSVKRLREEIDRATAPEPAA